MMRQTMRKWAYKWTEPPFLPLIASPLLVMATGRLSYTLVAIGALVWVFLLTVTVCRLLGKVLPRFGRKVIIIMLSGFLASLYGLLLYFTHPALASECSFMIVVTPAIFCMFSFEHTWITMDTPLFPTVRSMLEHLISIAVIMTGLALIREPLGYAALSFPGGADGITGFFDSGVLSPRALQTVSRSAGAFLLLGYLLAVFRHLNRDRDTGIHPEQKSARAAAAAPEKPQPVPPPPARDKKPGEKK